MCHLAVHSHFHLQTAVVGGDDLVAETGGNHQVGLDDFFLEQPAWPHFAAKLFVVREQQLDAAAAGFGHGLQGAHGKGVAGEVALAHRCGTAIQLAVFNLAAVGVFGPAFAGGHHVTVGIEQHGFAGAIGAPYQQVGHALHADGVHFGFRHGVLFGLQTHAVQQLGGALGVRCVVAGRRVGGDAYEFLQELHLLVKVGVDPGVELFVRGAHGAVLSS